MKPKPLPQGGTIAIVAPSSRGMMNAADEEILRARGFNVSVHPQCFFTDNQSAGTAAQRASALSEVFADPKIDAIMAMRGGNRAMHVLPLLDMGIIKNNRKPFIGFSDATVLLNAFYAQTGLVGYHGPSLSRVAKGQPHEIDQMIACLQGQPSKIDMPNAKILQGGKAKGPLIGGNLSMMAALCGTPYMPKAEGAILFLEDIGDQLSRYDRMLAQLRLAGVLQKLSGIIFGQMIVEGDSSVTPFGFSLEEIIREHIKGLNIPVLMDAPFGHSGPLCTLPVGGMATLDADAKTILV